MRTETVFLLCTALTPILSASDDGACYLAPAADSVPFPPRYVADGEEFTVHEHLRFKCVDGVANVTGRQVPYSALTIRGKERD